MYGDTHCGFDFGYEDDIEDFELNICKQTECYYIPYHGHCLNCLLIFTDIYDLDSCSGSDSDSDFVEECKTFQRKDCKNVLWYLDDDGKSIVTLNSRCICKHVKR